MTSQPSFTSSISREYLANTNDTRAAVTTPLSLDSGPLAVMPEQFGPSPRDTLDDRGEYALMRAVLDDALHCYQQKFVKRDKRTQRLADEAARWLWSNDEQWPFSFVRICAALAIDPAYIRRKLKEFGSGVGPHGRRRLHRVLTATTSLRVAA